jgi:antagonist of KipI
VSITIQKPGVLNTVQDLGRFGYRRFGINPNGAMDRTAVRLLNTLLGNDENCAVIEMHFPAGEFSFENQTIFSVGGADFRPRLGDKDICNWTAYEAEPGDVLSFPTKQLGNRAYLAVSGGFEIPPWLGSASTNLAAAAGGFRGRRLQNGDRLFCNDQRDPTDAKLGTSIIPTYCLSPTIRMTVGPEYDLLTGGSVEHLFSRQFTISRESDRMGFRLHGPTLNRLYDVEMISSGATFGTIQLLPDGQMVILMADHQTTGGYPRIGNIVETDLPLIAQLNAGDKVYFELIDLAGAQQLIVAFERELAFLRTGLRLRAAVKL